MSTVITIADALYPLLLPHAELRGMAQDCRQEAQRLNARAEELEAAADGKLLEELEESLHD